MQFHKLHPLKPGHPAFGDKKTNVGGWDPKRLRSRLGLRSFPAQSRRSFGAPGSARRSFSITPACERVIPATGESRRHLAPSALSQFTDFSHQRVLGSRREESVRGVEAAAFITSFFEHA